MRRFALGIVLGALLCVIAQSYGDVVVRHVLFWGGYVKASGILLDRDAPKAANEN